MSPTKRQTIVDTVEATLTRLFASYPNTKVAPETVQAYLRMLQDIPAGELEIVVDQCLADYDFVPAISEIRQRWLALKHPDRMTAADAWLSVTRAVLGVGYMGTPRFRDPLTARVVEAIGWRTICESEEPGVERAHFMRMYDQWAAQERQQQNTLPTSRQLANNGGLTPLKSLVNTLIKE